MAKVFDGSLAYTDAAKKLNLPTDAVWKCFANHWQVRSTDTGVTLELREDTDTDDYIAVFKGMIKRLVSKLDQALRQEFTPMNVGATTKLSAECRSLMRDILEFQGKLQQGPLVQLNIMQVQMTKLTNWIVGNLPQEQVERLLKALPELIDSEHAEKIAPHITS